jgi:hypothetical protein
VPDPELVQRIRFYLMSMGYDEKQISQVGERIQIASQNETAAVVPLSESDMIERATLVQSFVGVSALQRDFNRVYLVVPRLFAAAYDTRPFQEQGIGLIVYDSRRIEEILEAKRIEHTSEPRTPESAPLELLEELRQLKQAQSELEDSIRTMKREISRLTQAQQSARLPEIEPSASPPQLARPNPSNALPVFFDNNPWLDVLSRRGKETSSYAA